MMDTRQPTVRLREAYQRAVDHHSRGELQEAGRWLRAILDARPAHFDSLHLLAIVVGQAGRYDEALQWLDRALDADPHSAKAHCNRAMVLRMLDRRDDALASCDRALIADGEFAEAHRNRAAILKDLGRHAEALAACDRALELSPQSAELANIRGAVLQDLHRLDEAVACFDRAIEADPDFAEAYLNRGGARNAAKRHAEALADCDRALTIKPGLADAHYNRGLALSGLERHADAEKSFGMALARKPEFPMALRSRAGARGYLRRHREAAEDLERALALSPDLDFAKGMLLEARMFCCDWRAFDEVRDEVIRDVRAGKCAANPLAFLAVSDSPQDQLLCARTWIETWHPPAFSAGGRGRGRGRAKDRLHVAYLSGDFREHAVAYLCAGVLESHDRSRIEATALSFGSRGAGPMRARLESAFERFVDVASMSDGQVADLMVELGIDIAVDLGGLTGSARTGILSRRPATLQVNFLGYTGTMGSPYIDYIVADDVVIPPDERIYYDERVVYMPDSFQPNDRHRAIADATPSRAEAGLPEHGFVFCSFNNAFKITPQTFARWMRILGAVDGSVLWLLEANDEAPANLRRQAVAAGVAPERLVFAAMAEPADHLARHRLANLFLDTLPFNAHTTASDALWAGVPVLTCAGTTFAGRVAASLLRAVGLPRLVTNSPDEYEALAVRLATRPEELSEIVAALAINRGSAPLFDTLRYCRHLESAYTTMWQRYLAGEPPSGFSVEADTRPPSRASG